VAKGFTAGGAGPHFHKLFIFNMLRHVYKRVNVSAYFSSTCVHSVDMVEWANANREDTQNR